MHGPPDMAVRYRTAATRLRVLADIPRHPIQAPLSQCMPVAIHQAPDRRWIAEVTRILSTMAPGSSHKEAALWLEARRMTPCASCPLASSSSAGRIRPDR